MSELLSPAGSLESFYIAIANGADAIYLGLKKFSARAYANNFTIEILKDLIDYAHLRNVKVYVTINTIIYDNELPEIYKTIDDLAQIHVDALIIQDLAVFYYLKSHYKSLKAHASTQMGIDDFYGASTLKMIGFDRIVFARETPIEELLYVKNHLNVEIETFIHGALCVSYSGNCFMSSMIGDRSSNRGRCAGCCRQVYSLVDLNTNQQINTSYLLSMKDLNSTDYIEKMSFIDSFKIEGRMKEPWYVAYVTSHYRKIIDNQKIDKNDINFVFNRTYTKGFINGDNSLNITNIEKPNNFGVLIGTVVKIKDNKIWIKLTTILNKGDQIRIESKKLGDEISLPITKLFDANFNLCTSSSNIAIIYTSKKIDIGAKVYKTKDKIFVDNVNTTFQKSEFKKLPISMKLEAKIGKPLFLSVVYKNYIAYAKSKETVDLALTSPITKQNIVMQLSKLNDTPYFLDNYLVDIDDNCFVSLKTINQLRRDAINVLNSMRLNQKIILSDSYSLNPKCIPSKSQEITVKVTTIDQYNAVKSLGINHIYFDNIISRNNEHYIENKKEILIGGFGSFSYYKDKDVKLISDYSFNITNHISAAYLFDLGVDRVTLSPELDSSSINELVSNFEERYGFNPNFEIIIYGRMSLMHSKYCPLKRLNICGQCKKTKYVLKDKYESFPLFFNSDCTTTIYNSKITNLIDYLPNLKKIKFLRLDFTTEQPNEVINIITSFQNALEGIEYDFKFDQLLHTRGHFLKRTK